MNRLGATFLLLSLATTPLCADDCPSDLALRPDEQLVSGVTALLPHGPTTHGSAASSDSTDALIWSDRDPHTNTWDIRVSATRADGTLLSPVGTLLSSTGNASRPDLVWTGEYFLASWLEGETAETTTVHLAHLTPLGELVRKREFPRRRDGVTTRAAVAANQSGEVVVIDYNHRLYLYGIGPVLEPEGIEVSIPGGVGQGTFDVAASPASFLVTWNDYIPGGHWSVGANIIRNNGSIVAATGIDLGIQSSEPFPQATWSGSEYVVAWRGDGAVDAVLITTEASVRKAFSIPAISPLSVSVYADQPRILVFWTDLVEEPGSYSSQVVEFDTNGKLNDSALFEPGTPTISSNRDTITLFWGGRHSTRATLPIEASLDDFSAVPQNIIFRSASQGAPEVVRVGEHELAAWIESPGDSPVGEPHQGWRLWVRDLNGTCTPREVFPKVTGGQLSHRIVSNGDTALLVWVDVWYVDRRNVFYTLKGQLLARDGSKIRDIDGLGNGGAYPFFELDWNGSSYALTSASTVYFIDDDRGEIERTLTIPGSDAAVGARRIVVLRSETTDAERRLVFQSYDPASAAPLSGAITISEAGRSVSDPTIIYSDGLFAIAYISRTEPYADYRVHFVLVSDDGAIISQSSLSTAPVFTLNIEPTSRGFVASWSTPSRLMAAMINRTGAIEDTGAIGPRPEFGDASVTEASNGTLRVVDVRNESWNELGRARRLVHHTVSQIGRVRPRQRSYGFQP